jgi:NAD(P)-dependent dehydrogenase (short-subunit alcohol dehydrogenase family)
MSINLEGQTAVITGSSKGIGYAIAEQMVAAGANVVISARKSDEVEEAARRLNGKGEGRVIGVTCDVRRYEDVQALIRRTVEEFDGLDILVNNAGVGGRGRVDELPVEKWQQVIETNLSGVFYCCHEAIPHLRKRGGGWIINIASLAGKNAFAGGAAYNASKFGLVGFSEALMLDVRYDGIRVNYIMPGSVNTHFFEGGPSPENDWMIQPEDIARTVMNLLAFPDRTLPSRIEIRPTQPPKK